MEQTVVDVDDCLEDEGSQWEEQFGAFDGRLWWWCEGSSSLDPPMSYYRQTLAKGPSGDEICTPTSTASMLSIPMPARPLDYDLL